MGGAIRILDLFPDVYLDEFKEDLADRRSLAEYLERQTNGAVTLETVFVDKGNASIEDMYDEALAAPYVLQKVKWAETNGFHAVVVDCFIDVALDAARELVEIPVMGACQSSCSLAARLGGRFSVLCVLPDMDRPIRANLAKYGLIGNLVSIRSVNVPVLDLRKDAGRRIAEEAKKAVLSDGACTLVLGCTGMSPIAKTLRQELVENGLDVPVIEPLRAAVYDALNCVLLGVSHSKASYLPVKPKHRVLDWEP